MKFSRRGFLGRSGLVAASTAAFPHVARPADAPARAGQKPRHIIHMVADGMSAGTLTCADHFSQILRKRGLTWMQLYNRPGTESGLMNMRSLNSLVTDSSAASSSWGSGSRIVNGTVNILPDGAVLKTIYELFAQKGWKRGLVTTTEITHATPAGFAASGLKREAAEPIAAQYLDRGVEVLLGGGQKFFDPKLRKDKRDLRADYAKQGYSVMTLAAELAAAPKDKPWLGIFASSHLPFTLYQRIDAKLKATVPTLAVMTRRALEKLGEAEHFILQVEGGRVDHACHTCDAAAALHDQIAFDEAIDVCLEFQKKNPDTLIVITTDHGNGNLGLNGMGGAYSFSSPLFGNLKQIRGSFGEMVKKLIKSPVRLGENTSEPQPVSLPPGTVIPPAPLPNAPPGDAAVVPPKGGIQTVEVKEAIQIVAEFTGYKMPQEKAEMLIPFLRNKGKTLYSTMNNTAAQLGQLLGNHIGIGWTSNAHTADYVPIVANGPGAELFRGFIVNTDVFKNYVALGGIDFKNPESPLLADAGPEAGDVENHASYLGIEEHAAGLPV
jgi:alkaline phosphatase